MAPVPFYPALGNHDVAAKFPKIPDALGVYYFFHPPQNGPGVGPWSTPLGSDKAAVAKLRAGTADSYPSLDAYSFENGPVHVVALNSNMSGDRSGLRAGFGRHSERFRVAERPPIASGTGRICLTGTEYGQKLIRNRHRSPRMPSSGKNRLQ